MRYDDTGQPIFDYLILRPGEKVTPTMALAGPPPIKNGDCVGLASPPGDDGWYEIWRYTQ